MAYFNWKDEYTVHSEVLDDQHKKLFEIANELYEAFTAGEHKERMGDIIDRLYDYTVYHFTEEEKLIQQLGNSLSETHLQQHQEFIQKVKDIADKYKNTRTTVTYGLMSFLRKWLTDHILKVDQNYVPVLRSSAKINARNR